MSSKDLDLSIVPHAYAHFVSQLKQLGLRDLTGEEALLITLFPELGQMLRGALRKRIRFLLPQARNPFQTDQDGLADKIRHGEWPGAADMVLNRMHDDTAESMGDFLPQKSIDYLFSTLVEFAPHFLEDACLSNRQLDGAYQAMFMTAQPGSIGNIARSAIEMAEKK